MDSSETESYTSDKMISNTQQDPTLDELFSQLSEELHKTESSSTTAEQKDNFKSIEASIRNLPKLESNFGKTQPQAKQKSSGGKSAFVVKIHDPVAAASTAASTRKQAQETSGSQWFNMSRPEMTSSIKRDLQIIKQRQALDPKRHYKKDKWQIPKFFQMGTIVEGNTGYSNNRLSKRQQGTNLVEELLHDDTTKKYFKRKYHEIQQQKTSGKKSHYKKVKNDRKKY
ncbi:fcf2 [Candida metapsilosis]|uniref:Fcf2 n=1 Tax=Candida metapsilosis TaxID=273372 RepID=A0A8H7ZL57_9ASCO|nr:fcf2 [Candida metapsilosis]